MTSIDCLRQMIANLRPPLLDELGLASAIEVLCEKHPTLEFSVIGDEYATNQAKELVIFRAAQEAIYNAERHAKAKHIVATLTYSNLRSDSKFVMTASVSRYLSSFKSSSRTVTMD